MRYFRQAAVVTALLGACATVLPAAAEAAGHLPHIGRVSTAADGSQADGDSDAPVVSAGGRHLAFTSRATNLVPGVRDGRYHLYVKDIRTGATDLVDAASDGTPADGESYGNSISGDGRYVAFASRATNLAPGRHNTLGPDVYVRDRWTGRTEILTENRKQEPASSSAPSISADGRYVAFDSSRRDLVPYDTNDVEDVFVHDRRSGTTARISVRPDGSQSTGPSYRPVISADGSRVVFQSIGLGPIDWANPQRPRNYGLYAYDMRTRRIQAAARTYEGAAVEVLSRAGVSPDGRHVFFSSNSAKVVRGDTNDLADTFAVDLHNGTTQRLSLAPDGTQANGPSFSGAVMSADGRHAFFASAASNLVAGDTNQELDLFAHDLRTGRTERINLAHDGAQADDSSDDVSVDAAGRIAVFSSRAGNLVPHDTNRVRDVFLRHLR